jgi:hypothetical protein
MSSPVDLSDVLTWPQAAVAIVIAIAILVVPQIVGLVQNGAIKRRTEAAAAQLTNNGGSTLKDAVDRIERKLTSHVEASTRRAAEVDERLADIEATNGRRAN